MKDWSWRSLRNSKWRNLGGITTNIELGYSRSSCLLWIRVMRRKALLIWEISDLLSSRRAWKAYQEGKNRSLKNIRNKKMEIYKVLVKALSTQETPQTQKYENLLFLRVQIWGRLSRPMFSRRKRSFRRKKRKNSKRSSKHSRMGYWAYLLNRKRIKKMRTL